MWRGVDTVEEVEETLVGRDTREEEEEEKGEPKVEEGKNEEVDRSVVPMDI